MDSVEKSEPCQGCAADCCRKFQVVILGWDVYRVARDLQLPPESFVELQGAAEPDAAHQLVLDVEERERRYHRMALRKRDGGCVFLLSLGSVGRCGIYSSRPDACRSYPAIADGDLVTLARREYCPPGSWEDIDAENYRLRYQRGQKQRTIFDVVGDGWNERILRRRERRGPADFFAWLMRTYAALEKRVPHWFDDSPIDEDDIREQVSSLLVEEGWL
jgi:Fe-S-cluster containining protein